MSSRGKELLLSLAKWCAIAIVVYVLGNQVYLKWDTIRGAGESLVFRPGWMVLSLSLVWIAFAGLIEGWQRVIRGWGEKLPWLLGARIWILSSFGKYLPGRIWAIAGMKVMSERAGVRGSVATAAAIVMQLLAIGAGVAVAAIAVGREAAAVRPGAGIAMALLGVAAVGSLLIIGNQGALNRIWSLLRRESAAPSAPRPAALFEGITLNLIAWILYGTAFWALAKGILPDVELGYRIAVGGFATAYLAGLLAIFAPGGMLVREALLVVLIQGEIGAGPAVVLAAASRLMLSANEIGAAIPFLIFKRRTIE